MKRFLVASAVAAAVFGAAVPAGADTPLVMYKYDQASSGTSPTTINDTATGTAVNLTAGYGTAGAWTSITAGKGRTYDGTSGSADISGSLASTKVATSLSGITTATMEAVIDTTGDPNGASILSFDTTSIKDLFYISTVSAATHGGTSAIGISYNDAFVGFCPETAVGLHVLHVVADTGQATAANRILCYIDGASVALTSATYPAQNTAVDALGTNYANNRLCVACDGNTTIGLAAIKIYFVALYATVMSSGTVSSHSTALLANNDADPNSSSGTAGKPGMDFGAAPSAWNWAPPPCVTGGASPTRILVEDAPILRREIPYAFGGGFQECSL